MKKHRVNLFCPFCGTKILDGKEAEEITLPCKRCRAKMSISFNNKKIHIEIINGMDTIAIQNTS